MTPDQLAELAQKSVDRARAAETAILETIAKRLAKGLDDEKWAVKRMAEVGALRAEVRRTVRVLNRYRSLDLKAVITTAYTDAQAETVKTLAQAGLRGAKRAATVAGEWTDTYGQHYIATHYTKKELAHLVATSGTKTDSILDITDALISENYDEIEKSWARLSTAQQAKYGGVPTTAPVASAESLAGLRVAKPEKAIAALTRDLEGRLASTDKGVLRASQDIYRQVIGRVTAQGFEGEFTRRTAAQAALNQFADRGITGFIDTAEKVWSLPSYTEMACRTSALNASREGKLDSMRAVGNDLAIISTSPSACPDCAEWEGEIISLDGATPGYPTLADAEGSGHLFGPNCGHSADPYVEGVTVDTSAPSDPELYEARQTQRGMERSIRQWKTRGAVALDDKAAAAAKAKVSEWQGKLRDHVAANDLKRLSSREQIGKAI